MTMVARHSPLQYLVVAAATQIARRPYLSLSVVVHAGLLALLYYFGSYQPELREQEAEVASSLRATSMASTAKRLQDLKTIKELLEKSADRAEFQPEPVRVDLAESQTPQELVERARELSEAIEALDKEIQAEELGELLKANDPSPAGEAPQQPLETEKDAGVEQPDAGKTAEQVDSSKQDLVTPEMASNEVAALEAKARATLARRQERLEAKANGVQVEGENSGSGEPGGEHGRGAASPGSRGSGAAVRAEIAEFIGEQERREQGAGSKGYSSGHDGLFDGSYMQVPAVDATNLVRGRGRMLGTGGEFANRVYLNSWYVIGPFPGRNGPGMFDNPAYPPEKAVLLDAVYFGKENRLLKWRYVTAESYPFVPPDSVEDSVYYGYTEVFVDQACDLTGWFGSDDDLQVYLNDHMVWRGGNVGKQTYFDTIFNPYTTYLHDYNRTEGKRELHFKKGRNRVFFKLSNGPNDGFVSMVLTRTGPGAAPAGR
jgi:hypothetical protein